MSRHNFRLARICCLAVTTVIMFQPIQVSAAVQPDAGKILEGLPRPQPELPSTNQAPVKIDEPTRPPLKTEIGEKILVKGYRVTGQTLFPEETLLNLVKGSAGKEMNLGEIELQASKITSYLKEHGYIMARAYVPAQKIVDNIVELAVIPGRYDKITIRKKVRIDDRLIRLQLGDVRSGEVIEKKKLERAIWLVGDLSGVEAKATLEPGTKPGTTNLILDILKKDLPFHGSIAYDNFGNRFTGKNEITVSSTWNNPAAHGDQLSFYGITTGDGLLSGNLAYRQPLLTPGGKMELSVSRMKYQLGDDFASLDAAGKADTVGLTFTQNLVRSRRSNLYWQIGYTHKALEDKIGSNYTYKASDIFQAGFSGNILDEFMGGGITLWTLNYSTGSLAILTPTAYDTDSQTANTAGRFGKFNLSLTRQQRLHDRVALLVSLNAQWAGKNLDSSEKMSLGGAYGVRAYPKGEASGDDGWLASAELFWSVPQKITKSGILKLSAFVDAGGVTVNHSPWAGAAANNQRSLFGAGVGLNWIEPGNLAVRLNYSWKLGSEQAVSDTDANGRLWLQVTKYF